MKKKIHLVAGPLDELEPYVSPDGDNTVYAQDGHVYEKTNVTHRGLTCYLFRYTKDLTPMEKAE